MRVPGVVRTFMLVALLTGVGSEVFDRLWTDRVLRDFDLPQVFGADPSVVWFAGGRPARPAAASPRLGGQR